MHHRYIDSEYKDLINTIFTCGLKEKDLHLTNRIDLKNVVNTYLKENDINTMKIGLFMINPLKIWQILTII